MESEILAAIDSMIAARRGGGMSRTDQGQWHAGVSRAPGADVTIAGRFDASDSNRRESQSRVECESTGQLEAELFAAVDSVIAARK